MGSHFHRSARRYVDHLEPAAGYFGSCSVSGGRGKGLLQGASRARRRQRAFTQSEGFGVFAVALKWRQGLDHGGQFGGGKGSGVGLLARLRLRIGRAGCKPKAHALLTLLSGRLDFGTGRIGWHLPATGQDQKDQEKNSMHVNPQGILPSTRLKAKSSSGFAGGQ